MHSKRFVRWMVVITLAYPCIARANEESATEKKLPPGYGAVKGVVKGETKPGAGAPKPPWPREILLKTKSDPKQGASDKEISPKPEGDERNIEGQTPFTLKGEVAQPLTLSQDHPGDITIAIPANFSDIPGAAGCVASVRVKLNPFLVAATGGDGVIRCGSTARFKVSGTLINQQNQVGVPITCKTKESCKTKNCTSVVCEEGTVEQGVAFEYTVTDWSVLETPKVVLKKKNASPSVTKNTPLSETQSADKNGKK